jgi:hypothetical protein
MRRVFWGTAMKDWVRRMFNGKLDFLSSRISSEKRDQHKGRIQRCRHAGSADDVAVPPRPSHPQGPRRSRASGAVQTNVSSPASPREHQPHRKAVRRCRRKTGAFPSVHVANERKNFFIVHQCLLPIAARHVGPNGTAAWTSTTLANGMHSICATYSGNTADDVESSDSHCIDEQVLRPRQ